MSMGVILWKKNAQQNEIEIVTDVVLFYRYLDTWILNPNDTRLKKNMSLPIPLCGSNLRKDLQLTAASTQQLIRYQTVSVRALPAMFLETPSYSSICISWGFARASDLWYFHKNRHAHPSLIDAFVFYGMKYAWREKQFPFQHHLLTNDKSKGIRQGFIIYTVYLHVTRTKQATMTDSCLLLKADLSPTAGK